MAEKLAPRKGRKRRGAGIVLGVVLLSLVGGASYMAFSGRALPVPALFLELAEVRAGRALAGAGTVGTSVEIGGAAVMLDRAYRPRVRLRDITVREAGGEPLLSLPEARIAFLRPSWTSPAPRVRVATLVGARINVRRQEDGSFDLAFGVRPGAPGIDSYTAAIAEMERFLQLPALSGVELVNAEGLTVSVEDARAARTWELGDGSLRLTNRPEALSAELGVTVQGSRTGRMTMTLVTARATGETRMDARVTDVAAADIGAQAAPLAALAVVDASVSGQVSAAVDGSGALSRFDAALDLGKGALSPTPQARAIPFDAARMALTYDPDAQKVALTDLRVESPTLRVEAAGHAYLRDMQGGLPATILSQMRFRNILVDPEGLFTQPVRFSEGSLDARLRLDPFTVEIGQVSLVEGTRRMRGDARISAGPDGWRLAADVALNQATRDDLIALWPVALVPRTREWLAENVLQGDLRNVDAAVRLEPDAEPRLSLAYEFSGAEARFLRTLPPIQDGRGYASIEDQRYAMTLVRGHVTPAEGGEVDAAGSVFAVNDVRQKPTLAEIRLDTRSSVTAALSLLDEPPFGFMTKAGRPVDIGEGRAEVKAILHVPLVKGVKVDQVDFDVQGVVHDFRSDTLVKGRELTAELLTLVAKPDELRVSGPGLLGQVPFDAAFVLPLDEAHRGQARVEGTVALSQAAVDEFRLGLPAGTVSGQGQGVLRVDLPKGQPPALTLTSDLRGVGLGLAAIGWSKAPDAAGRLEVEATLGDLPEVQRLALQGGGLDAIGRVTLREGGGLDAARFSRVRLNGWLDAPVTLAGRGAGVSPQVVLSGGRVDLRRLSLPEGKGGSGGDPTPIRARLDELRVSDSIALTDASGEFTTRGGFNGTFAGRVNGGTPLSGVVGPVSGGTGVHLESQDAGGVLASAGIFPNAQGGAMEVTLNPTAGKGNYVGRARATGLRIRNVPVVAELLNAISVVGLLEQLNGSGILFSNVDADFRLTPGAIEVTRGSAYGASMGVSSAGVYTFADKRFHMQGVVSPIYLLNGIGALVSQRGEGLFGFNYRLGGTADDPQISVNPLSLLTPGAFRELFRNPPPRLAQ